MISICCCAINSKYEVNTFVRSLARHNKDVEFEVCLAHDDRVGDGSEEYYKELQKEFSFLKIIRHTHEDTVNYLEKLIQYYETNNIFDPLFRHDLLGNINKFKKKELFDTNKQFLWLSSGLLYNKAISISSGDLLVVTPADFVYLFSLKELRGFYDSNQRDGEFYAKFPALWARLTNQDPVWLYKILKEVQERTSWNGYRWDHVEVFRDYLRTPSKLSEEFFPDFRNNLLINLDDESFPILARNYCIESFVHGDIQSSPSFHGFHAMSRKTYDSIGGFTEEYPGRAWADDKMTALGAIRMNQLGLCPPLGHGLPSQFAIAWCGQYEVGPYRGEGYPKGWETIIREKDPLFDKHPTVNGCNLVYLHHGLTSDSSMIPKVINTFKRDFPPVRII